MESSSTAARMRDYRKRKRFGVRSVRVPLDGTDIDFLIQAKLLNSGERNDLVALKDAILGLIYRAQDEMRKP